MSASHETTASSSVFTPPFGRAVCTLRVPSEMRSSELQRSVSLSEDRYNALARNTFDGFWYRAEVLHTSTVTMMHTIRSWAGTKLAHFDDVIQYNGRRTPENWRPVVCWCLRETFSSRL